MCIDPGTAAGTLNVTNAALAVALCAAAGADVDRACAGIADVAVPGRLEPVRAGQDFLAVVDYAHKPAAVEAVLGTLAADCPGGSRWCWAPVAIGTPASARKWGRGGVAPTW